MRRRQIFAEQTQEQAVANVWPIISKAIESIEPPPRITREEPKKRGRPFGSKNKLK